MDVMSWFIRKFLQITILLCVLLAIAAVVAFLFVSPNNYRDKINQILQEHTGYQVTVNGPIDWSLGSTVILNLKDVVLIGPEGFKSPLLTAKQVNVTLDFMSIFKDTLVINKLEVTEMVAAIERQATGARNIDLLKPNNNSAANQMSIIDLSITNSTVLYQNEQTNRHWALNNLSAKLRNLVLAPKAKLEPLTVKADLTNLDYNVSANIEATINIDMSKDSISFDPLAVTWNGINLTGNTSILQLANDPQISGKLSLNNLDVSVLLAVLNTDITAANDSANDQITGTMTFNAAPATRLITISDFALQMGEGSIKGNSQIVLTAPYKATFDITANKMNIMPIAGLARALMPMAGNLPGVTNALELFKTIDVKGKLAGTDLTLFTNFKVDHVTADLNINQGQIQFGPITAKAYDAAHNLNIEIDVNQLPPAIKLIQKGDNIVLEKWTENLGFPTILSGTAVSKVSITTSGYNMLELKQSATGGVNILAKDGNVIGIDIEKLQQYTIASINDVMDQLATNKNLDLNVIVKPKAADWGSVQKSNPESKYQSMELNAEIKQGVSDTSIKLTNPTYVLNGNGTFNLASNEINFKTQITNLNVTPAPTAEFVDLIKQAQLPLDVSGNLDQLSFKPDLQNYIVNIIKQAQDSIQKKAVASMVAATGPNAQTSKSAEEIFVDSLKGLKQ